MKKAKIIVTPKGVEKKQIALRMTKPEMAVLKYMAEKEFTRWGSFARILVLEALAARGVEIEMLGN